MQHEPDARDAEHDEHGVRHGADRGDDEHVLAAQALAQHEQVLRADRDDEREAEAEAGEQGSEHASTLGGADHAVQLMILQVH